MGHMARDCRSRSPETQKKNCAAANPVDMKPIVCFTCRELGHKSPQCPKMKDKIKRILIKEDMIERQGENDVMSVSHRG